MPNSSKANKLWNRVDARIQFYGPDDLRRFFSASAKFLITQDHWDDTRPPTRFDRDPIISVFHEGFTQFSSREMLGDPSTAAAEAKFVQLLRQASGWGGKSLQARVAKRKLTQLRRRMKKRFLRYMKNGDQPLRGLSFYDHVIRTEYLNKQF
jgi:hypothetical protein